MKNPYDVLGVPRGAKAAEVKAAYRELAKKYHPDTGGGDEARFKEATEAFNAIKAAKWRWKDDGGGSSGHRSHSSSRDSSHSSSHGSGGNRSTNSNDIPFDDFYSWWNGRGGSSGGYRGGNSGGRRDDEERDFDMPQGEPGGNVVKEVKIDMRTAASGASFNVHFERFDQCPHCGGAAHEGPKPRWRRCPRCNGAGCDACDYAGWVLANECPHCDRGRVRREHTLRVELKGGVGASETVVFSREGDAGTFGDSRRGDLRVTFKVSPEMGRFRAAGNDPASPDVELEAVCPLFAAFTGAPLRVPTIDGGEVEVPIKAGAESAPNRTYRFKGRGRPVRDRLGNVKTGDMVVRVRFEMPVGLTIGERLALEAVVNRKGLYPESDKFAAEAGVAPKSDGPRYDKFSNPYVDNTVHQA